MQIITKSYFTKQNALNIPLSLEIPTAGVASPNNENYIDLLCLKVEKDLLLNALGFSLYNEFQIALADLTNLTNPLYAKWNKLLNGDQYDGKNWNGLKLDNSLIANRIFEIYLTETNSSLTQSGNVQTKSENANLFTPAYKIANSNQEFIRQYQGKNNEMPYIYDDFIDYYGNQEGVEVCLFRYLIDKKADFIGFDSSKFKFYETANSFGL